MIWVASSCRPVCLRVNRSRRSPPSSRSAGEAQASIFVSMRDTHLRRPVWSWARTAPGEPPERVLCFLTAATTVFAHSSKSDRAPRRSLLMNPPVSARPVYRGVLTVLLALLAAAPAAAAPRSSMRVGGHTYYVDSRQGNDTRSGQ